MRNGSSRWRRSRWTSRPLSLHRIRDGHSERRPAHNNGPHNNGQGTWAMNMPVTIDPRFHDAVVFDLDGVVTDTASIHAAAWALMFNDFLQRRQARNGEDHS